LIRVDPAPRPHGWRSRCSAAGRVLSFLVWAGCGRYALDSWIRHRVPGPVGGASYDDIGEHWRVTELLAEQRREADWRSRATSAVCLGVLAGLLAAGYAIQAARLG
jgi:hypothetical protein